MQRAEWVTDVALDAEARLLDGGTLTLAEGDRPLAVLTFPSPAFAPAAGGRAQGAPLPAVWGQATGTVTTWVARTRDGRVVYAGTAGTGGAVDLVLNETRVTPDASVRVAGLTLGG